jgi:hypothetical protein
MGNGPLLFNIAYGRAHFVLDALLSSASFLFDAPFGSAHSFLVTVEATNQVARTEEIQEDSPGVIHQYDVVIVASPSLALVQ